MTNAWIPFGERLPQLGMKIDVIAEDTLRLNLGKIICLENLEAFGTGKKRGWIGINTEYTSGAAVLPHYKWRRTKHEN